MTEAKALRRRRRTGANNIPATLAQWFAGEREPGPNRSLVPWAALIYPDGDLLSERWQAWKEEHPDATPPAGFEWLDDPKSPRHKSPHIVKRARECAKRLS